VVETDALVDDHNPDAIGRSIDDHLGCGDLRVSPHILEALCDRKLELALLTGAQLGQQAGLMEADDEPGCPESSDVLAEVLDQ